MNGDSVITYLDTLNGPQGVCPAGWHLPSYNEWIVLVKELGNTMSGGKLKSTSTELWLAPNVEATNSTGFTALPAGQTVTPVCGYYKFIGEQSHFWSSTGNGTTSATAYYLSNKDTFLGHVYASTKYGYSVRCIKD